MVSSPLHTCLSSKEHHNVRPVHLAMALALSGPEHRIRRNRTPNARVKQQGKRTRNLKGLRSSKLDVPKPENSGFMEQTQPKELQKPKAPNILKRPQIIIRQYIKKMNTYKNPKNFINFQQSFTATTLTATTGTCPSLNFHSLLSQRALFTSCCGWFHRVFIGSTSVGVFSVFGFNMFFFLDGFLVLGNHLALRTTKELDDETSRDKNDQNPCLEKLSFQRTPCLTLYTTFYKTTTISLP